MAEIIAPSSVGDDVGDPYPDGGNCDDRRKEDNHRQNVASDTSRFYGVARWQEVRTIGFKFDESPPVIVQSVFELPVSGVRLHG